MGDRSRDPGIVKLVNFTKLHDRWALPFLTAILLSLFAFSFPAPAMAEKSDLKTDKPAKKNGPEIPLPALRQPAKGSPVNVEAEHLVYDPATEIAVATGQETHFSEAEMDQLETGMDGFGDALYLPGVAKPGVEAPAGASRQDRVLARMGRAA